MHAQQLSQICRWMNESVPGRQWHNNGASSTRAQVAGPPPIPRGPRARTIRKGVEPSHPSGVLHGRAIKDLDPVTHHAVSYLSQHCSVHVVFAYVAGYRQQYVMVPAALLACFNPPLLPLLYAHPTGLSCMQCCVMYKKFRRAANMKVGRVVQASDVMMGSECYDRWFDSV
jgi:hypothetical protein